MNKKGQGLPLNTVILGIIVIVVLIIILIFFVGGTAQVTSKIKDIFTGRISAQSAELAVNDCKQLCESAKALPENLRPSSGYCTKTFIVDLNKQPTKVKCGSDSRATIENPSDEEKSRGVAAAGNNLGQNCDLTNGAGTPISCNAGSIA